MANLYLPAKEIRTLGKFLLEGEEFYDVKTGLIARKNYFKNKMPLWVNLQNGV